MELKTLKELYQDYHKQNKMTWDNFLRAEAIKWIKVYRGIINMEHWDESPADDGSGETKGYQEQKRRRKEFKLQTGIYIDEEYMEPDVEKVFKSFFNVKESALK